MTHLSCVIGGTFTLTSARWNGRVCGWACLGSYDPALVPEAPIGLIKKDSTTDVSFGPRRLLVSKVMAGQK